METAKKKPISWRSVGTCLLILFVGVWILDPAVMHVMAWHFAADVTRDQRGAVMPKPLAITGLADLSRGADAKAFGYSLRFPWTISKQSVVKTLAIFDFPNGASARIVDDKNNPAGPGLLANTTAIQAATYKRMYGEQALSSRYAFLKAEFDASPSDISFWHSRVHNLAAMTQLMEKDGMLQESKVIYTFAEGNMRGFQVGEPTQSKKSVCLWLFDAKDSEIWLILSSAPNAGWTQEQINAVVASIRPAS